MLTKLRSGDAYAEPLTPPAPPSLQDAADAIADGDRLADQVAELLASRGDVSPETLIRIGHDLAQTGYHRKAGRV